MPLLNGNPQPDESPLIQWLISSERKLVIVIFYANWSGSIQFIKGHLQRINEARSSIATYWVNLEEERELSVQLGVTRVPTMVVFKNREVVDLIVGVHSRKKLGLMIDKHLNG